MYWPTIEKIYAALWPLFVPCTDPTLTVTQQVDVPYATWFNNNLVQGVQRAELTVWLCPTPVMHILVITAVIGLLFTICALVRFLVVEIAHDFAEADRSATASHDAVAAILKELDRTSDEHLRRVRNL